MKRNIVIAAVTAAALIGGGTATALATTGDDDPGTTRQSDVRDRDDDARGAADDRADDDADDRDGSRDHDRDRDDRDDGRADDARASSAKVTAAEAVAAALKEAPGTSVSAELDEEDGDDDGDDRERAVWEVDVLAGDGTWHSVWIDPGTGKVLGSETDDEDDTDEVRAALKGTSVDAAEAAKAAAGRGTVTSVELDEDGYRGDGVAAWEVETTSPGKGEQDWRVDLKSGKVTADRSHHSDSDDADDSGSDDD
ncbi:PepSY domain-containing protein [Streptomyces mutabilis]|uniref:PepSY domain-containing protein n=1 Tax=Streptomyces mutabilis TaxID=67332 RepID=UPI003798FD7F